MEDRFYTPGEELADIFVRNGLFRKIIKQKVKELFYHSAGNALKIRFDHLSLQITNHGRVLKSMYKISSSDLRLLILCLKINGSHLKVLFPGRQIDAIFTHHDDAQNASIFERFPDNTFVYFQEKHKYYAAIGQSYKAKDLKEVQILREYDTITL